MATNAVASRDVVSEAKQIAHTLFFHSFVLLTKTQTTQPTNSATMSGLEHEIAIDISRALNLVNPNDLLARQVIQIARNHKQANGFVKGKLNWSSHTPSTINYNVATPLCNVCLLAFSFFIHGNFCTDNEI